MGDFRPINLPHAIGWMAAAAAALGVQGGKWAANTGRNLVTQAPESPAASATPTASASDSGGANPVDEWV